MHWLESALGGSRCHCDTVAIAVNMCTMRLPPFLHFERLQQMPPNVQGFMHHVRASSVSAFVLVHLAKCCEEPSRLQHAKSGLGRVGWAYTYT